MKTLVLIPGYMCNNEMWQNQLTQLKKKYKVILTGGLAHIFSNSLQYKSTINTSITLQGVVEIIKYNKKLF